MNPADVEADRKAGTPERICVVWPNPQGAGLAFTAAKKQGQEYIRADLHAARIAALEASLGNAIYLVRVLTGPDDSIGQAFIEASRAAHEAAPSPAVTKAMIAYHDRAALILSGPGADRDAKEQIEKHRKWADELRALTPAASPAPDLSDPNVVHLNMLRGTIAKPTVDQIIHIYGIDALCKAIAPQIVREAALKELADLGQAWDAAPGPEPSDAYAAGLRRAAEIARAAAMRHEEAAYKIFMSEVSDRLAARLASYTARCVDDVAAEILAAIPAPWTPPFEFDRYINGVLMAEGVAIERATTIEDAARKAALIASRGPNGEAAVLVYRAPLPDAPAQPEEADK